MFEKMHTQNNILAFALNAYTVRNEVIQHNIANVDTPRFKRKAVDFEVAFAKELERFNNTGNFNAKKAGPKVRLIDEHYSNRLDGNNVNIDVEMAELYKNSVRHNILIDAVINNYRKINLASTGR